MLQIGISVLRRLPNCIITARYRELQEEFGAGQVGLKTGDLSLNPDAPCLVMTTEILRNMLYRGAVEIQEVKWVIFDEIQYGLVRHSTQRLY